MLSSRLASTVCAQRQNFAQSGMLEKPIKNFVERKTKPGAGSNCVWYKMGGTGMNFKTCQEVKKSEAGKSGKSMSILNFPGKSIIKTTLDQNEDDGIWKFI